MKGQRSPKNDFEAAHFTGQWVTCQKWSVKLNKLLGVIDCVFFTPKKISLTAKKIWLTNLQILTNYKITCEKYNNKKSVEKNTIHKILKLI